jgi:hypothetical protein
MDISQFKAIAWMVAELGLIPALFVVLMVHFLRQIRDLRDQNSKLVAILERTNTETLTMIRGVIEAREEHADKERR